MGEQMNRKSLSKILATVGIFVFTVYLSMDHAGAAEDPQQKAVDDARAKRKVDDDQDAKNALINNAFQQKSAQDTRCDTAQKDLTTAQGSFLQACKQKERDDIRSSSSSAIRSASENKSIDESISKGGKALQKCAEHFHECLSYGSDADISNMQIPGMPGMPTIPDVSSDEDDEDKRCSDLSTDNLKSAVEKATTALDTKKKDLQQMMKDNAKSESDAQQKLDELQQKMLKDQDEWAKVLKDKKEQARNQKASYDQKKSDFDAQLRKSQGEMFQLQQQSALSSDQGRVAINGYKLAMLDCKAKVLAMRDQRNKGNEHSQLLGTGLSSALQSDAQQAWSICASNALQNLKNEQKKYTVAMDQINMNIKFKAQEITALQNQAKSFVDMYNSAEQERMADDTKEAQRNLENQKHTWTQLYNATNEKQKRNIENQQLLTDAQQQVQQSMKDVNTYKSQKALSDKPLSTMRSEIEKYRILLDAIATQCDSKKLTKLQADIDALKPKEKGPAPASASKSSGTDGG
jgi:hypothetical protein